MLTARSSIQFPPNFLVEIEFGYCTFGKPITDFPINWTHQSTSDVCSTQVHIVRNKIPWNLIPVKELFLIARRLKEQKAFLTHRCEMHIRINCAASKPLDKLFEHLSKAAAKFKPKPPKEWYNHSSVSAANETRRYCVQQLTPTSLEVQFDGTIRLKRAVCNLLWLRDETLAAVKSEPLSPDR